MAISTLLQQRITVDLRYLRTKRLLDILFSLLIFIPLCIVIVIIAVFIRLDSPGPIFYRQKRVGLDGAAANERRRPVGH